MTTMRAPLYLDGPNGRIAFDRLEGERPFIVWLGGYRSDMTGTKAEALAIAAAAAGRAFLRFDYSGHGASDGAFEDGTISRWLDDALAAIDALTDGPLVLVGSSMGGWIAALAALRLQRRLRGVCFIAPAPDFTEALMWEKMTGPERDEILRTGRLLEQTPYSDEPNIITRALIEDGRKHLMLGGPIAIDCAIRIIQGMQDPDVPWRHALSFADCLQSDDIDLTLVKSGDHRLSAPDQIAKIIAAAMSL